MMKAVRGVLVTVAILLGCIVAALAVANAVDMVWPGTLLHGRNMTRVAMLVSGLIVIATLLRRRALAWRQIAMELAIIEVMMAGLIWQFAGGVSLGAFFASWWLGLNAYLVLPWLIAAALPPLRRRG
jgi:hypothetical protein